MTNTAPGFCSNIYLIKKKKNNNKGRRSSSNSSYNTRSMSTFKSHIYVKNNIYKINNCLGLSSQLKYFTFLYASSIFTKSVVFFNVRTPIQSIYRPAYPKHGTFVAVASVGHS